MNQLLGLLTTNYLWVIFLVVGVILYLLKLHPLRKVILFLSVVILGFYLGGCPCPSGSVFHVFTGVGSFLFIISTVTTLLFGRVYCGWVCPLGAVQELVFIGKYRIRIPKKVDKYLKYVKFVILAVFLYLTISTSMYLWGRYEPFKVLFNFGGNRIAFILLLITLGLSMFIERGFCRYICPMGAIFSIISRFSIFGMRINKGKCVNCLRCTRDLCPMGSLEATQDKIKIDKAECIDCLRCKDICTKGAPDCR